MSYVLITPIKNEVKSINQLKRVVLSQTIRPSFWVIVDGKSKDGSFEISRELFEEEWIHVIQQKTFFEKGYSHKNFAQAINEGYNHISELRKKKKIKYEFIGKTDATPILANNYFETLMSEMKKNPKLAIICGTQHLYISSRKITMHPLHKILRLNDIRLYRREFFEEMGGYPLSYYPDAVLAIKAMNKGWDIKITNKTSFKEPRLGGSKIGIWKGYKLKGKAMYGLWFNPLLVLLIAAYNSFKYPPHYQGIAMLQGYISSIFKKDERIDDNEIKRYFSKEIIRESFKKPPS